MRRRTAIAFLLSMLGGIATVGTAPPAWALTCAESGETPGVIEAVLAGTHPRSGAWDVIAAGAITAVEPVEGDYGTWGADITMDVAYWFRGGGGPRLQFFDQPRGSAGVGFEVGAEYLVLASDLDGEAGLSTDLCSLTYRLPDFDRIERMAERFGASVPDTAITRNGDPLSTAGWLLMVLAGVMAVSALRNRRSTER